VHSKSAIKPHISTVHHEFLVLKNLQYSLLDVQLVVESSSATAEEPPTKRGGR
jgi:hypothetical protein